MSRGEPSLLTGPLLTLGALALCWPVWVEAGWLLEAAGLDLLDLPGRVCAVFLALGGANAVLRRVLPPGAPETPNATEETHV